MRLFSAYLRRRRDRPKRRAERRAQVFLGTALRLRPRGPILLGMREPNELKALWRAVLDRMGGAGRRWRKGLIAPGPTEPEAQSEGAPDSDQCARLKRAIKAERRLRAQGHWQFSAVRLRALLGRYVALKQNKRR